MVPGKAGVEASSSAVVPGEVGVEAGSLSSADCWRNYNFSPK